MEKKLSFLEAMQSGMTYEFWSEEYKSILIKNTEFMYKPEIIREWCISDLVINNDKVLFKWSKRYRLLTDEELMDKYGYDLKTKDQN